MGWTQMEKPSNPKQYLDDLHNSADPNLKMEVLKSALKNFNTYYAAVKSTNLTTGESHVWAGVILVRFRRDGHYSEMWYKCIDESAGPYQTDCPESILKLLTPTENEYAKKWRKLCYERIHARKALSKALVHGNKVKFKKPITFNSGAVHQELYVWNHEKTLRFSSIPVVPKDTASWFDMPEYNIDRKTLLEYMELV